MTENSLVSFNDPKKLQLLKDTICKGSTNNEFELFVYACKRLGLDPFSRQIFPVKRWNTELRREVMTIQTGIDGYRLIADRTGRYAPGKPTDFEYKDGKLFSATAYVKKQTADGSWHEVSATCHFDEYVAKTKSGEPNNFWATKGHVMLSKCAEASALRKAFPAELSGVYTKEEMEQAGPSESPQSVENEILVAENIVEMNHGNWLEEQYKLFNRKDLDDYIEACAAQLNMNKNTVIEELRKNEAYFQEKFKAWRIRNGRELKINPGSSDQEQNA